MDQQDHLGILALEKAIRGFAENPSESVVAPKSGTSFDSLGEAYDFYNLYSWEKGFHTRYGKSRNSTESFYFLLT